MPLWWTDIWLTFLIRVMNKCYTIQNSTWFTRMLIRSLDVSDDPLSWWCRCDIGSRPRQIILSIKRNTLYRNIHTQGWYCWWSAGKQTASRRRRLQRDYPLSSLILCFSLSCPSFKPSSQSAVTTWAGFSRPPTLSASRSHGFLSY